MSKATKILNDIPADEIERGINLCLKNASNLIDEGTILFNANKFPRSYTLFQLANEELGKVRLLYSLFSKLKLEEEINWDDFNYGFIHHQSKSIGAIDLETISVIIQSYFFDKEGEKEKLKIIQDFGKSQVKAQHKENIELLNNNKNNSLYVGVTNKKFVLPDEVITPEMANELMNSANQKLHICVGLMNLFLPNIDELIPAIKQYKINPPESLGKYAGFMLEE